MITCSVKTIKLVEELSELLRAKKEQEARALIEKVRSAMEGHHVLYAGDYCVTIKDGSLSIKPRFEEK